MNGDPMESKSGFKIKFAFASIVPPLKGVDEPTETEIVESKILDETEPGFDYLLKLFDSVHNTCKIGITFESDGDQNNQIRSLIVNMVDKEDENLNLIDASWLANHLAKLTDERNKTGLFVILIGKKLQLNRVVLLRFRAEEVVYKKSLENGFRIDRLEQAYSQNSKYYKAAYYEDYSAKRSTFWDGFILDKQRRKETIVSEYWLKDFLLSDYSMSNYQGTLRLADYIKNFAKAIDDVAEQQTIFESVRNLRNNAEDRDISVLDFADDFLPVNLRSRFKEFVGQDDINASLFNIDFEAYDHALPYHVMQMENGISLIVPTFMGNDYLTISDAGNGKKKYSFEGKLIKSKFIKRNN